MRINVTVPDGPMADALREHAERTERSPANLARYALRLLLNKRGYGIPPLSAENPLPERAGAAGGKLEEV